MEIKDKRTTELKKEVELVISNLNAQYGPETKEYTVAVSNVVKENNLINENLKLQAFIENQEFRNELDKKRLSKEFLLKNREAAIAEEKNKIEREKLKLEEDKLIFEKSKLEIENKKKKLDKFIDIGLKVLEIGLPLAVNAGLVLMNFRLVYNDDGRTPSEMKDLFKNVYRK